MVQSNQNHNGLETQSDSPVTQGQGIPETDDEWFALIQPEIAVSPADAEEDTVIEVAQCHARQVVDRTGMAVNLDQITWCATHELRAKHGYAQRRSAIVLIKLSLNSLATNGWQRLTRTVRHELVHAWQHQNSEFDDSAPNNFERAHGPSFEEWMPVVNIGKKGGPVLPSWTIVCPACEVSFDSESGARAEEIAQRIQTLDREICHECNHEVSEYMIKRNGEQISVESLPDVLSEAQDTIFLYNKSSTAGQSPERDWHPETRHLTSFTGIGEKTARQLGQHTTRIDELWDADNETLSAEVRSVVPGAHHEALREEIQTCYQDAVANRSTNDLSLLDRVMSQIHYDWWEPVECLDGTGSVESMCLLLRDETESSDQLRITIENHGEYTAEVVATKTAPGTAMVGVEIEPDSTLGSQGIIELPAPHRGDYPTFRYKQDPPEPTPAIIGGDSEEIAYVVRRENVTAVEKLEHHLETT